MTAAASASLSFNEIEALGTKAARGAGLGWGQAEDLGRAARWFAERGWPWSRWLLSLLDRDDAASRVAVLVGAADRAGSAREEEQWSIADSDAVWIVPLLAASCYGREIGVVVRWTGGAIELAPDGTARASADDISLDKVTALTVEARRGVPSLPRVLATRPRPTPLAQRDGGQLFAYADRTAVPATEASRARGAGSGQPDND